MSSANEFKVGDIVSVRDDEKHVGMIVAIDEKWASGSLGKRFTVRWSKGYSTRETLEALIDRNDPAPKAKSTTVAVDDSFISTMERHANASVIELFNDWIAHLESTAVELKRQRQRFIESTDKKTKENMMATPSDVLSWAVNTIRSIPTNMRLDLAVTRGAELGLVRFLKRQQEEQKS